MIELIPFWKLLVCVLIGIGVAIAITCTKAGRPIRVIWALVFRWHRLRWTWKLVMCPHCNSWWSTGAVTYLLTGNLYFSLQAAFTALGVVYTLQRVLARNTVAGLQRTDEGWIAEVRGVSFEPDEDLEDELGLDKEK